MLLAPSRLRTVANENAIPNNGSTESGKVSETNQVTTIGKDQEQTPLSTDSTGLGIGLEVSKVSTNENRVDIPGQQTYKFTLITGRSL